MPQPDWVDPELATLTRDRFSDLAWIYERKFDGERCLAYRDGGQLRLMTRNHQQVNSTYPELDEALGAQAAADFIVDGEVVAFVGRETSFAKLQQRLGQRHPDQDLLRGVPVYYYLFDVMYADGRDVRDLPLRERKRILRDLITFAGPLRFATHRNRNGEAYYAQACRWGWEGLIAKRADAPYRAGRGHDWLKFKCLNGQEFVIGGYTDPQGSRHGLWRPPARLLRRQGPAGLRRQGRHRVHRGDAGQPVPHARGPRARRLPRSRAAGCRSRGCTGSSRISSARSDSASGPPRASCAIRGIRACGGTRIQRRWSGRGHRK